jgi:excisionase family DNA binding protein
MGDIALLVSVDEAASRLSIGERLTKRLIATGELPSVKIGARRLIHRRDLEQFAERLREGVPSGHRP